METSISPINVEMSPEMFVVLMQFVQNVRLGDRNEYESAVSDFAIEMEKYEDMVNKILAFTGYQRPAFRVEASDEDGLVFNVE